MRAGVTAKTIKEIIADIDKCTGCLTYEVRQLKTEVNELEEREAMKRGLESLVKQHGIEVVIDKLKRLSKGQ